MSEPEETSVPVEQSQESAEEWKAKGNEFYKAKKYSEAADAYGRAIAADGSNALLYTNRAAASLMLLQFKEAVSDCDTAIALDATCSKAYFRKASALRSMGRLEAAIAAYDQGLVHEPNSATALKEKNSLVNAKAKITEAQEMVKHNQFTAANIKLDQIIKEIGSSFREVNLLKVQCLIKAKRLEEALNLTNQMMKTAQNGDVELLAVRASCLFNMGEIENAFKHLQQAVRSDPDNTAVRAQYRLVRDIDEKKKAGDEAFKTGKTEDAIESWTQCIDLIKDSPIFASKVYLNRAIAYSKLKKHELAVKDCTKAIYFNSEYIKAYIKRGDAYLAQGGPEKIQLGIEDYEKAAELEHDEDNVRELNQKVKKAKVALKRSKRKDLYAIMGVAQDATEAEIKTAYRKLALKYHPDRHSSKTDEEKTAAETMFKSVNEAYEILSNAETRAKYDSGVEVEDMENPHAGGGHGHGHGGIDPSMLFHMFQQGGGGGGRRGGGGGFPGGGGFGGGGFPGGGGGFGYDDY